ncbi:MAG: phage holin family protein [Verrucomicrobiota bacterium]
MGSLMEAFRRAFDSFIQSVETRLDLFTLELQEEKIRFVHIVLWLCAAVFLTAISLVMVTMTIVVIAGEEHKTLAMVVCSALYVIGAIISGSKLYQNLYHAEQPFSETISQLKQDRDRFKPKS